MRLVLALIVACLVAACGLGTQSSAGHSFLWADAARAAQADLDAQAILQGMAQARVANERVARDINRAVPEMPPSPVTR